MKKILILSLILSGLFYNVSAQKRTFFRIYDLMGKKITKGYYAGTTDSSLILKNKQIQEEISFGKISKIKTKRSRGHTILAGSIIGAICGAGLGVFSHGANNTFNTTSISESIAGGIAFGTIAGGLSGAIISIFRKSETFVIDGTLEKWRNIKIDIGKFSIIE